MSNTFDLNIFRKIVFNNLLIHTNILFISFIKTKVVISVIIYIKLCDLLKSVLNNADIKNILT